MELSDNDIVISGLSGRFPNSNNVREFSHNLYNKIDMTDEDESRWKHFNSEVPRRFGKIRNLEKFDASFFSTLNKHANWTDPQMRILLEHAYEAIIDAGVSPQSLVGSRTGVFIGCSISDSKDAFVHRYPPKDGYVVLGNANFYLSNRISYALGLCGPSFTVDTACSSSAYALDCAFRYLESGVCDAALVGGSQLILNCGVAAEYTKLGILASDGVCRPFDENATGFSRADTICVIFLQKHKDSKRVYANLVYSSSNNDGFKKEGASFPSKIMQQRLIEDFYKTLQFDPGQVNFVEAHSTGTKLGDPEEIAAIDEVFCKNNNRSSELLIGSVKSNMGHAEAASGMASIAKILITLENRKIPPNINLTLPRSDVSAFAESRVKVATDTVELQGQFIAMNSFGLGGGNAHALFRGNSKEKLNHGIPDDVLGRMLLWSGRTVDAINAIFDDVTQRPLDVEHIALLQNSQAQTTSANIYRGFGMFTSNANEHAKCMKRDIQHFSGTRRPIVFVYSGIGSQWPEMGRDLMKIPLFAKSIDYSHRILLPKGIDLKSIITSSDKNAFNNVMHSYVGIIAIEIALTDIMRALGIVPDYLIAHSVGEIGCSYADGCSTAEETILMALARGESSNESETIDGAMAAIGMHHMELVDILPKDIDIACHNSNDSSTISGPVESIRAFVEELKAKKIFAKEVACSGVPLHSRYIAEFGDKLRHKLQEIIKAPKLRSKKWLSSTFREDLWNKEEALYSSVEYHVKNLLNPVFFEEITNMLPKNAVTIEIAPHGLLQAILKRGIKEGVHVSLTQRNNPDGMGFFLEALGRLFQHGVDMDISKLYPPIQFPVSRGTPMISPLIKWNHQDNYFVPHFDTYNTFERRNIIINISDKKYEFIQGHMIDGRVLFPATGWIVLVWETFAMMNGMNFEKVKVVFEDVRFLRATSLDKNQEVLITISIHRGTGSFEVIEGSAAVALGIIKQVEDISMSEITILSDENTITLQEDEFYKEMRLLGFYHLGEFKGVKEIRHDGLKGKIKWSSNWITFLDSMTHFEELETKARTLALPTNIRKIVIDPFLHYQKLEEKLKIIEPEQQTQGEEQRTEIIYDVAISPYLRIIQAGGVEIHDKRNRVVNRRRPREPLLEINRFIPYFSDDEFTLNNATKIIVQTVLEDISQPRFTAIEFDCNGQEIGEPLCEFLWKALRETPLVISEITFLTSRENVQLENVEVSSEDIESFNTIDMIIKSNCLGDHEFIERVVKVLAPNRFILSRESKEFSDIPHPNLQLIAMLHTNDGEFLHLLQVKNDENIFEPENVVEMTSNVKEWLQPLKTSLQNGSTIIYSHDVKDPSGILGFVNCIRREFPVDKLKCFLITDPEVPPFDINNLFYQQQLKCNHAVNVFKDGKWGGYRYLDMLPELHQPKSQEQHMFAYCLVKGDLSSLAWLNGPLNINNQNLDIVTIQYSSLNFKDIMLALGRIPDNVYDRVEKQCVLGLEFSGMKNDGKRVMGIGLNAGSLATHYDAKHALLWDVPEFWSLEEAATVPLVYFTVYFAYFITTKVRKGKKILIHSGSGGVGQAAIEVAFAYGLEVFTTVSTEDKKNFLLNKFPKLKPENVGNSRNATFEKMILENTKGKGVDYVLNSLSGDKLQASIRCLNIGGTLLEIGKYDILNGTYLDMRYLTKRINLKAVIFDDLTSDSEEMKIVYNLVDDDVKSGIIKPLNTTVFNAHDIEEAFRFMANGKHIGKVLLKVREEERDAVSLPLAIMYRVYCDPDESFIIVGGLGGFGLELADWLVLRGCRKLVLSSSRGITNHNQFLSVELWKIYGATIVISTANVTTEEGCEELINTAIKLGGKVGGIFNLAVVLRDGIFDNLDLQMFNESLAPKALATKNLDTISRRLCPSLKHFVVFSSVSCGRGNAGQSNYGMANSIMERIIENRLKNGLPGKAIQWGAVGDVGLLAEFQLKHMGKDIGGTLPQSILSCLEVLDRLLISTDAIVSSMVVADKNMSDSRKGNIIETILKIMGIRDRKLISMDSTLTQLGIDSLMGVEIQQVIEREYDIAFTTQELRSFTLSQLEKRAMSKDSSGSEKKSEEEVAGEISWMRLLMGGIIDEETMELYSTETIVQANDVTCENTKILIIPGFYGVAADLYRNLANELNHPAFILQLLETSTYSELEEIVEGILPDVLELFNDVENFVLIGHSFGTILTLKLAAILESNQKFGHIIQLDGSPQFCNRFAIKMSPERNDDGIRHTISMILFDFFSPFVDEELVKRSFQSHDKWADKIDALMLEAGDKLPYSYEFIKRNIFAAFINRFKMVLDIKEESFSTLKTTRISLINASKSSVNGIHKDFGLSRYTPHFVSINTIEGDHVTLVNNLELPKLIKHLLTL